MRTDCPNGCIGEVYEKITGSVSAVRVCGVDLADCSKPPRRERYVSGHLARVQVKWPDAPKDENIYAGKSEWTSYADSRRGKVALGHAG